MIVFVLFLCLLFIFCRCKRTEKKKKDYEMASIGHGMSLTSPKNQAPPPYMEYPNAGMENKALEHSMDLTMDDSKNAVYASQPAYGYHIAPHATPTHVGQNMSNLDCEYIIHSCCSTVARLCLRENKIKTKKK